jgi:hypothetical protein
MTFFYPFKKVDVYRWNYKSSKMIDNFPHFWPVIFWNSSQKIIGLYSKYLLQYNISKAWEG